MIDFDAALNIARNYYRNEEGMHITKVYEAEDMWIIYAKKGKQVKYGNAGISVNKNNGETQTFILPSRKNFEILKKAKLTEIDEEV